METLAFGYHLVEAPRVDDAGNLYFTDVVGGGVFRRAPDGALTTVVERGESFSIAVQHAPQQFFITRLCGHDHRRLALPSAF